ncbi:hypothetical protein R3P38DRAFT_3164460 [Favolaschia claudopus]|uniref:Uncharacterized protein n=1 Tax=Favolaschia claudopus TaxID=2862362 RepID=A0AAW0ECT0_9AGAR
MNPETKPRTFPLNLFPANTHPSSDPKLLHLASHNVNVVVPEDVNAAQELLHFVSVHRAVCKSEELTLRQKLHSTVLFLHVLQAQIDAVMQKSALADRDVGCVSAILMMNGPPGIHLGGTECQFCYETYGGSN